MAFRRRARRLRRGMNRAPSAFAPSRQPGGRALTWEALWNAPTALSIGATLTAAQVVGARTISFRVLMPHNLTRGVVTLKRIRGSVLALPSQALQTIACAIQLVPVRADTIASNDILDPLSAFDLESNRIIWRKNFLLVQDTVATPAVRYSMHMDIDVKSQRRWARNLWSLAFITSSLTANLANDIIWADMRALFSATDAL